MTTSAPVRYAAAIDELRDFFGRRLTTGQSERVTHSHDEASNAPALPDAVVYPETTEEVSKLVAICAAHQCPVVPYGIGSSLEGHVIPLHGGVSVDTSRMNQVIEVHVNDMDAVVQPGVTRTQLNSELKTTGLMFTVDPGADATLGGMAATRASGTNTVRYGTMRENVLALEVVMPDGSIIKTGSRARKSATGYDLTHLFVGSEGTLGIITQLTVRLYGQPDAISAATCAFDSIDDAVNTVIGATQMGIPMARIELLDDVQIRGMNQYNTDMKLAEKPHLFVEFHGTDQGVAEQVELFHSVGDEYGMSTFQWATQTEDRTRLWHARHNAYYAAKALRPGCDGIVTDCCVPISQLAACIGETRRLVEAANLTAPLVGHVGDGNFHLLILVEPGNADELERARELANNLNRTALKFGGTVSGEHGIGSGKLRYMAEEHGAAFSLMGALKKTIDPANIMNPGKLVAPFLNT